MKECVIYLHFIVLSYLSFFQISDVFLSLKPNNSNFHSLKNGHRIFKTCFPFAQCLLTAAEVPDDLITLLVSMLLKEVSIGSFTRKFQVFKIKNTICGWHIAAVK